MREVSGVGILMVCIGKSGGAINDLDRAVVNTEDAILERITTSHAPT